MSEIREEFRANALTNEAGDKLRIIRESFSALLVNIETVAPPGRHLALVKTKLEEACMFAVRAVAVEQSNQAAVQVGSECTEAALIGEYERRLREGQKALDAAGINHTL